MFDDDIDPGDVFDDPTYPKPSEFIRELADTKVLTEHQAEVFVRRSEGESRHAVAEHLDITKSGVDSVHQTAKENIRDARRVAQLLEAYWFPDIPTECDQCGGTLGAQFVGTYDGGQLCIDCADVDEGDMELSP